MTYSICTVLYPFITSALIVDTQPWWSDSTGTWIGSMAGVLLGGAGAIIGGLGGAGKGRRFVLTVMKVFIILGAAGVLAGIAALFCNQPYGVWYPLLLVGGLALVIMGALYPGVRRRYGEIQLRKIQAEDV